jgi:hypothetical protein
MIPDTINWSTYGPSTPQTAKLKFDLYIFNAQKSYILYFLCILDCRVSRKAYFYNISKTAASDADHGLSPAGPQSASIPANHKWHSK